jgi:hypothetical protein
MPRRSSASREPCRSTCRRLFRKSFSSPLCRGISGWASPYSTLLGRKGTSQIGGASTWGSWSAFSRIRICPVSINASLLRALLEEPPPFNTHPGIFGFRLFSPIESWADKRLHLTAVAAGVRDLYVIVVQRSWGQTQHCPEIYSYLCGKSL